MKKNEPAGGERLDRVLQTKTGLSRKKVKQLLDGGRVQVNGRKVVIASWEVGPADRITVLEVAPAAHPAAGAFFLKVVFEDPHLMVVEKEAGVPCERSAVATRPTMLEIVNQYLRRRSPHLRHPYVGPVHRLDQETSGLMVFTKSPEANRITEQFKRHTIGRRYLALVAGRIEREGGTIEGFLQKSDLLRGGRKVRPSTPASGRRAVTRYRVLERYDTATLVEVTLNTGRTHQIRVQMASVGHPVVGDKIYGSMGLDRGRWGGPAGGWTRPAKGAGTPPPVTPPTDHGLTPPIRRHALHASFLRFHHPITGERREFRSELPRDLRRLIDRLRTCS